MYIYICIYKVCDASGCTEYDSQDDRRTNSGVTVEYEIKADAAAVAAIEDALRYPNLNRPLLSYK